MEVRRLHRAAAVLVAVLVTLLTGCAFVVTGRSSGLGSEPAPAEDSDAGVVGATDDAVDVQARNALADLQAYWTEQFPDAFGGAFPPLTGGYFSVDPDDADPSVYPQGIGCGHSPAAVEGNAFYCQAQGGPNSDSISYDRSFLAELADEYGRFLPNLVMAHEFGHAVQARVGSPSTSIATETQADCFAGAWTAWVADGEAEFSTIGPRELDDVLRGYLLLRDPVGTSTAEQSAHGSYFDRVSAFQDGFDGGSATCRDEFGPDRVFTQAEFVRDDDFRNQGDAPYPEVEELAGRALSAFWEQAFPAVFGGQFEPVELRPFDGTPPDCADPDLDLVYCPDERLVGYDDEDLAQPLYDEIGDYAVVPAAAIPYGLAARDQAGLSADDEDGYLSAVCLAGWFSATVFQQPLGGTQLSPGDLDESVSFLLTVGQDERVLPGVERSGFELVDTLRQGFLRGPEACDVGV